MTRWMLAMLVGALFVGCPVGEQDDDVTADDDASGDDDSSVTDDDDAVPWDPGLPALDGEIDEPRGFVPLRSIVHLHSPYSHDACDGDGYVDGVIDEECLTQLRDGLCQLSIDVAYLADHPGEAAWQPLEDLMLMRDDDDPVDLDGDVVGSWIHCAGGFDVLWRPGIEDALMPVGLERHAAAVGQEADDLYNSTDPVAIAAMLAAGGTVLQNHTEGRDLPTLSALQDSGLQGVEIFNLHAMLAPDIREEDLGLDPFGWVDAVEPFTSPDGTGEPDLMFLGFYEEQTVSVERWDALAARGPMVGVGGTDAHRNSFDYELRDGERADGFRRNMRWFTNVLLAESKDLVAAESALQGGRSFVAFEVLGTPDGFAFWYEPTGGAAVEMGSDCADCTGGTLHLACPTLSQHSPRDGSGLPAITATVYRDGAPWQEGCGEWIVAEPGVYRARIDILPSHLTAFLSDDPAPYLHVYPWVYGNHVRILE